MGSKFIQLKRGVLLLVAILFSVKGASPAGREQKDATAVAQGHISQLTEPIGASRCQFCHQADVEGYGQSAMAHSLRRAGQEPDGTVETPDAKITMHSSSTGYWQQLQSHGETTNYRIDYVIGSGNHAAGYLLDVAGHLFQSPVAYYKSRQAYDLAPGYEGLPNPDFTRPIAEACLFCHSGTALKVAGTSNQYQSPPFSAEAITCERCHGSAEKHLRDPRAGTIINPSKLDPAARDSVCEQCHLLGVGRVLNPGRKFSDFHPGEPLEDVFTTYRNVSLRGADAEKFKVISHVEQLARSTCSRMSNGKLWCGTCHDPHSKPVEPVAYFRSKCLSCHTQNFSAAHPDKSSNCIGCHMPRRDAKDGGHTAFTDHRIQRRPTQEESLPADADIGAWREPAPELQKRNLGIAYINVGMERRAPPFIGKGYRMLTEVQTQFANDDQLFTSIGSALLMAKQSSEAEFAFERALQLNPESVADETNAASAYLQAGDPGRAIAHLERAVALDPLHLPADFPLIDLYKKQDEEGKAADLSNKVSGALERQATGGNVEKLASAGAAAANSSATAVATYKNIQVLKDIPSDQLIPAMRFITASLGVECSYCHVPDHFEKDDKKPKEIARSMMRMMFAIDKDSFAGQREVTCYSCHRGSPRPEGTPAVAREGVSEVAGKGNSRKGANAPVTEKLVANLSTADDLIRGYVEALGGAAAIERITSREEKGTTTVSGKSVAVEIFTQDPDRQTLIRHTPGGDSAAIFDGQQGWFTFPNRPTREMHESDLEAARVDANLHFAINIKKKCAELRVEYPEMVGAREANVISCANVGKQQIKLYFDKESKLLVRMVRYAPSPLGTVPTQIDYGDYRDVDGVKIPFRWTEAQPDEVAATQLERVQQNVPIGAARFAEPASSVDSKAKSSKPAGR